MRVMVAQPDPWLNELIARILESDGFEVRIVESAQECIETLDEWKADAVLLDLGLPGNSGFEVLHEMQSYDDLSELPVVILSNQPPDAFKLTAEQWENYGVAKVFYKPMLPMDDLPNILKAVKS